MLTKLRQEMWRLSCLCPVKQFRWWVGSARPRLVLGWVRGARVCPDSGFQECQCRGLIKQRQWRQTDGHLQDILDLSIPEESKAQVWDTTTSNALPT